MAQSTNTTRTLVNKRGVVIETPYTDKQAFSALEAHVNHNRGGDFAYDLIRKGAKHGLTEEQFFWVHKILLDIENPPKPLVFSNIAAAYARARDNGVRGRGMKIAVGTVDRGGEPAMVQLSCAGSRSKYPGNVWVTIPADNTYCGRIDVDGVFYKVGSCPEGVPAILETVDNGSVLPW